jgi:hypothetical protein
MDENDTQSSETLQKDWEYEGETLDSIDESFSFDYDPDDIRPGTTELSKSIELTMLYTEVLANGKIPDWKKLRSLRDDPNKGKEITPEMLLLDEFLIPI